MSGLHRMNELHNKGKENMAAGCELPTVNHEQQFVRIVAAEVASYLQVDYHDSDLVVKLLTTCLERCLCARGTGLLEQYLHTQLDILGDSVKLKLGLDMDGTTSVDYTHATHAKFNNILEAGVGNFLRKEAAMVEEIKRLNDELSDMRILLTGAQEGLRDLKELNGGKD